MAMVFLLKLVGAAMVAMILTVIPNLRSFTHTCAIHLLFYGLAEILGIDDSAASNLKIFAIGAQIEFSCHIL